MGGISQGLRFLHVLPPPGERIFKQFIKKELVSILAWMPVKRNEKYLDSERKKIGPPARHMLSSRGGAG